MNESENLPASHHAGMTGKIINHSRSYTHKFLAAKMNLTESRRTCSVTALLLETRLGQTTHKENP